MKSIYIVPLEVSDSDLIQKIISGLKRVFIADIKILPLHIDLQKSYSSGRNQFYSTQIISDAIPLTEKFVGKIVIITNLDIYIPIFTYIFGEAQLNGKLSIVSLCRLHEEFYTGRTDEDLLFERTMKEILHELGHNFGLRHCENWECVMHSSTSVEEVDVKGKSFCSNCLGELKINSANYVPCHISDI